MTTGPTQAATPGASRRRRARLWACAGVLAVAAGAMVLGGAGRGGPVPLERPAEAQPTVGPGDTAAVFLGDSYTEGWGASRPDRRWSALVARAEGWVELNQGQGGTGFVTASGFGGCGLAYCPTYLERVPEVVRANPDVVVIAGGENDLAAFAADPAAVRAAVTEVYGLLRQGLPQARIIAVGPSTAQSGNELIAELDQWVHEEATRVGAEYLSLIDPAVIEPGMVTADGVHVSDSGHRAIADRVLAGIR